LFAQSAQTKHPRKKANSTFLLAQRALESEKYDAENGQEIITCPHPHLLQARKYIQQPAPNNRNRLHPQSGHHKLYTAYNHMFDTFFHTLKRIMLISVHSTRPGNSLRASNGAEIINARTKKTTELLKLFFLAHLHPEPVRLR